jgi:chemotaxis family two-component system response regulator Rcp1
MIKPLSTRGHEAVVLLVEDNEDHVFLTRASFEEAKLQINMQHVDDGVKCMAFLRKQPPYENAPSPDLILLDIHMPRMDEALRRLPVIVLTTSAEAIDIDRMYDLRCSSYITKPLDFESFTKALTQLADYWLNLVVVPHRNQ